MNAEPPILFVQMDHYSGTSVSDTIPNLVPFTFEPRKIDDTYYRYQYPLALGHCRTVHSVQGITASQGVIFYPTANGPPFSRGIEYVAISRPTRTEDLFLMGSLLREHFQSSKHESAYANINRFYADLRSSSYYITLDNYNDNTNADIDTLDMFIDNDITHL
jgi:hypothetical protein